MIKVFTIFISFLFISCNGRNNNELVNLDRETKQIYYGSISQIINSNNDVLRFSMDRDSFSKFKKNNCSKLKEWYNYKSSIYITTINGSDYILKFNDLSYSVFRDNKGCTNLIIFRQEINELWVFKITLLM